MLNWSPFEFLSLSNLLSDNNMNNNYIYYIQPLSYHHNLTTHEIIDRLFSSSFTNFFTVNQTNKQIFLIYSHQPNFY